MILYYYVPKNVFDNIIKEKKPWLQIVNSDYSDTEMNLTLKEFKGVIKKTKSILGESLWQEARNKLKQEEAQIVDVSKHIKNNVHYFSTTTNADDGNHWYAYADQSHGVCLTLDSTKMKQLAKCGFDQAHPINIEPMIYRDDNLVEIIGNYLKRNLLHPLPISNILTKTFIHTNILIKESKYRWDRAAHLYLFARHKILG